MLYTATLNGGNTVSDVMPLGLSVKKNITLAI